MLKERKPHTERHLLIGADKATLWTEKGHGCASHHPTVPVVI